MFVDPPKNLNRTLDTFQTFAVGFLVKFIDSSTTAFLVESFLFNAFVQRITQLLSLNSIGMVHWYGHLIN